MELSFYAKDIDEVTQGWISEFCKLANHPADSRAWSVRINQLYDQLDLFIVSQKVSLETLGDMAFTIALAEVCAHLLLDDAGQSDKFLQFHLPQAESIPELYQIVY